MGRRTLGLPKGNLRLEQKQAAAAVGQIALAQAWTEALRTRNMVAAQVLVTLTDRIDAKRVYLFGVGCTTVAHFASGRAAPRPCPAPPATDAAESCRR